MLEANSGGISLVRTLRKGNLAESFLLAGRDVETVTVVSEDVHFALPKELERS